MAFSKILRSSTVVVWMPKTESGKVRRHWHHMHLPCLTAQRLHLTLMFTIVLAEQLVVGEHKPLRWPLNKTPSCMSSFARTAVTRREAPSSFLWRARTQYYVLLQMSDHGFTCLALCLKPSNSRLQLGDLHVFGLDCKTGDVSTLGYALSAQVVSVKKRDELRFDRGVQRDGCQDLEGFGCETRIGRIVCDRLALVFEL
jgi:hypothetical protein